LRAGADARAPDAALASPDFESNWGATGEDSEWTDADSFPSWRAIPALGLAALALGGSAAFAATAGDLDPSLDGDGKAILPFALRPQDVLVQPDGKIVVTDADSFTVLRLNQDGSLDRGWGGDGAVVADFAGDDAIGAAALQPDGKVVVAGEVGITGKIAVARLNPNGSPDPTFDPGGPDGDGKKVYNDLQPSTADAVLVQRDGRIVIAGRSVLGLTASRLKEDGAPDGTTFDYGLRVRGLRLGHLGRPRTGWRDRRRRALGEHRLARL
jgi:uncharacterized delta-60 repeat protein